MPKKRIKAKGRKGAKLTEDQKANLVGGNSILALMAGRNKALFKDEEDRQQAWEANKDRLYNLKHDEERGFIERYSYTRPPAWWDYEAQEPRQKDEGPRAYVARVAATEWDREKEAKEEREAEERKQ